MSAQILHQFYACLAPWLALSLLLLGRNPFLSRLRLFGSLLLAFFLLRIPLGGWSLFSWFRTLEMNPSFTLTGLLCLALCQRLSGQMIFRAEDWRAAWIVGAIGSLLLYPMGLGLTPIDPYSWGWGPAVSIVTAAFATLLLIRGNRFGIILILPLLGSLLNLQESVNFWDALIDPFYGGVSLIAVILIVIQSFRKCGPSV